MSDWYKMNPVDWNEGTDDLTLEQEAAYLRICHAMYVTGKPVADNKFIIAGLLRCNDRKATRLLDELVNAGKLTRECGLISNRRALEEISNRDRVSVERKSAGSRGGIESAKSRANALKNNDAGQAIASTSGEADKIREDKKVKEETNVSSKRGTRLPADWVPDILFAISLGMTEAQAQAEAVKFREWWPAQPGQKGVKLDWDLTWKTWCRKAVERLPGGKRPAAKPGLAPVLQRYEWIILADGRVKSRAPNDDEWLLHDGVTAEQVEAFAVRDMRPGKQMEMLQ